MKLRNKLIPLASCLAIGATVAPMTTACATSGFVDLKNGFTPTISRLVLEDYKLTAEKAEQVYFNAVSGNPEIFVQDFNWTMATALRTAAENPNNIFEDEVAAQTSILDTAKQSVTNVKVGKTTITHPKTPTSSETKTEDFYTISFDLVREQQYTWKHNEEVIPDVPAVQVTTVGSTMYTLHVTNIPMNFNRYLPEESNSGLQRKKYNTMLQPHLGRCLFGKSISAGNSPIVDYIPTQWFLSMALINYDVASNASSDNKYALKYMTDPWEISYEYQINDSDTYTYNDITETKYQSAALNGSFKELPSSSTGVAKYILAELINTTIGSHYLSDIEYEPVNK